MSTTFTTAHGNTGSLTHWARPRIEPETSWFLVGCVNHCATTGNPFFFFCLYLSLSAILSLFLYRVWGCVLISLICMQLSWFPSNACWIDFLLWFHVNFWIVGSSSVKNVMGHLIGIALIALGSMAIFPILIFPIQENGLSFHFFTFSLISLVNVL